MDGGIASALGKHKQVEMAALSFVRWGFGTTIFGIEIEWRPIEREFHVQILAG